MAAVPGLRERKRDRLRKELHQAATDLFLQNGFEATTIDEIVAIANVSRRTFFRYFDTKEDAWFGSPDADRELIETIIANRPASESPLASARLAYRRLMDDYQTDSARGLAMARLATFTPALRAKLAWFRERAVNAIADALSKRAGTPPDDLTPHVIAANAVWTIAAAVDRWIVEDGARPIDDIVDEAFARADAAFAEQLPHARA
jgi:AcrR family transcriptional regulator